MRILHVIGTMDPAAGGPTEVVRMLVQLRPAGTEAEVVTLDDPKELFLQEFGVTVQGLGPVKSTYGYSPKLNAWLERNRARFDGVVVHGLWQYCTLAVQRTMRGRVPYMVFPHGMLDPYFKDAFPLKHIKKWVYWLAVEYRVLRDAERVLFTTKAEQQLAEQSFWLHPWNGEVVPLGTAPPTGDPDGQKEVFYTACPQARGRPYLLFLGRIHPKKGCDMLVDAFMRAAREYPELDLVIAGPDPQNWRAELEQRVWASGFEARVHWPGMLLGDAKWGAFHGCEAFVLPSHQENFGIAVAEALACGRPVLLSDKVNTAAEIAADGAGIMEPDTTEGTWQLMSGWMSMPDPERAAMGQRARQCFERRYDMRESARAVVELFAACSKRRATPA
jgi:glycosyltransferase involved in cell wall biosynthesis